MDNVWDPIIKVYFIYIYICIQVYRNKEYMILNETFKQKQNKPVKSVINFNNNPPHFLLNLVAQKGHE